MAYNFQTFGIVVDDIFAELSINASNTIAGLTQTQVESWANRDSKIFLEKVKLKSQEDTYTWRTKADDTLAAAVSSGATSLTLSTSNATLDWPTSGMILLDFVPYTYSNIVTTTMTSEAVDRAFSAGDTIQLGYAVPTNFGKPRSLYLYGGTDTYPTIGPVKLELVRWGTFNEIPQGRFAVFNDFIFLPEGITGATDVTLHFYKKATNTLTTSSTMEIYQMWDQYVIYKGVARGHRILHDDGMAQRYEELAQGVMMAAKTQVAQEDLSVHRGCVPSF